MIIEWEDGLIKILAIEFIIEGVNKKSRLV